MSLYRLLFPSDYRTFRGKRWVKITLRTAHLVGTAGLGGGFLYQAPREFWLPYLTLTIVSGFAIMFLEIWTSGLWFIQLRGIAILVKLALLSCLHFSPGYGGPALVLSVVISSLISHAPGDIRYFSVFHGRRLDLLE